MTMLGGAGRGKGPGQGAKPGASGGTIPFVTEKDFEGEVLRSELPVMVENAVSSVSGVGAVKVDIVWDPPWDPSRMSDEARAVLNMW